FDQIMGRSMHGGDGDAVQLLRQAEQAQVAFEVVAERVHITGQQYAAALRGEMPGSMHRDYRFTSPRRTCDLDRAVELSSRKPLLRRMKKRDPFGHRGVQDHT